MKKIIFLTSILVATFYGNSQMSVYDCEVSTEVITQSTIENFVGDFHRGCIDLGVPQNFDFNGNFSKNIFATKEILLRDGFFAGDFNQFGGILLKIKPRIDYDVALMNYGDLNSIRRLEKLELGLSIPTDLQTKIHNYVTEQVVPPSQKLNPFWDTDIRVFGEFKHSSSGDEIFVDGFYTRDFESVIFDTPIPPDNLASGYNHEEYYSKTGYYEEIETDYPFRVRFAPPENGLWQCRIFIQVNGQTIHITPQFDFTVVESGKKGYVYAGNRYFMQDEKTFFPIGCNLPNPEHNSIWDPEIAPYLRNFNGDLGTSAYDSRREIPRSYRAYKEAMTALADNGANFFRIIMFPNSNDIEYEKLGNYYDRMNMAMEMDKILEKAEELDLYVSWNMQIHFNFQNSADAYHRRWTWNDTGMVYCYRALVDSENSQLFFTHEESKAAYKQRLRYILARWGYSTHIAMFELFSEINSLGSPDGESGDYEQNISFRNAIGEWHYEMSTYLKQHYYGKKHLIGPSYVRSRRRLGDFTTSFNSIDFASCNWYVWGYPNYHENFNKGLTKGMSSTPDTNGFYPEGEFSMFGGFGIKPFFASEAEALNMKCHIGDGPAQYAPHPIEYRKFMFMSIFSGLAGALPWDLYKQPEYFYLFREVKDFLELLDVDFENQGFHPGVYKINNGAYQYKEDYANRMIGKKNEEKVDMVYLRSEDRNFAVGAINNRTVSWANYFGCQPVGQEEITPVQPENVSTSQQNLKLKNMRTLRYYLDYYSPTNLGNPSSSDNLGPNVKIETTLNLNDDYIRLFRARRQTVSWSPIQSDSQTSTLDTELPLLIWEIEDSETETSNELIEIELYPNPVEDLLYIESSILLSNTKLQVMDLTGKLIFETKLNSITYDQEVDLSNLNSGIYLVRLIQNGVELEIKKISKL